MTPPTIGIKVAMHGSGTVSPPLVPEVAPEAAPSPTPEPAPPAETESPDGP